LMDVKVKVVYCRNPIFGVHCLHVFSFFIAKILTNFVRFFTFIDMSRIFNILDSLLESSPNHSLRFPGVQPFYISVFSVIWSEFVSFTFSIAIYMYIYLCTCVRDLVYSRSVNY